jgi:DNA excision repair protein ERCC-2
MVKHLTLSVHGLVDFVYQTGDLISQAQRMRRMEEGREGHTERQSSAGYRSEVSLSATIERGEWTLHLIGRADGLILTKDSATIEEIKTTRQPLDELGEGLPAHWAQAICYGFMAAEQWGLDTVTVRLFYIRMPDRTQKTFTRTMTAEELERAVYETVDQYLLWAGEFEAWTAIRDGSIAPLPFPYPVYREGQRAFAAEVYRTIRDGGRLFAQAPTGIGKTVSTLYPALKAMAEGCCKKIFYLTAKTITRTVAEKTMGDMRAAGLRCKVLTLTARDKVCFQEVRDCDPEKCPYAKGYFDRIRGALQQLFESTDTWDRQTILSIAGTHKVCPFECSLDASLIADIVICDYNYAFDPRVALKRFFTRSDEEDGYCFLVDEAHNLIDRAREMYSAGLEKERILSVRRLIKDRLPGIAKCLNAINKVLLDYRKREEEGMAEWAAEDPPDEMRDSLDAFAQKTSNWLNEGEDTDIPELVDLFFDSLIFVAIMDLFDMRFKTLYRRTDAGLDVRIFCTDPSHVLESCLQKASAAIFFSATLVPMDYHIHMLGEDRDPRRLVLPSPFPSEHLLTMHALRVSTRYRDRARTYDAVAAHIMAAVGVRPGHYLVFFPSYRYMRAVYERFYAMGFAGEILIQSPDMDENAREAFLARFTDDGGWLAGFAVMGGIFSEGIDLVGDALSGAVIVGVCLPQVCLERDVIRQYYDEYDGLGFAYAYAYPGFNRVMQAAGRVIRSGEDKGVVLLIDDRFSHPMYRELMPDQWRPVQPVHSPEDTAQYVKEFWESIELIEPCSEE